MMSGGRSVVIVWWMLVGSWIGAAECLADDSTEVRITQSQDGRFLYVRCYGWPGDTLRLGGVNVRDGGSVNALSESEERIVTWTNEGQDLVLSELTGFRSISDEIWVFRVEGAFVEEPMGRPDRRAMILASQVDLNDASLAPSSTIVAPRYNIGVSVGPVESGWSDWTTSRP